LCIHVFVLIFIFNLALKLQYF